MFGSCSGDCALCTSFDGCLAGGGEDLFRRASGTKLRRRLEVLRAELLRAYRCEAGEVVVAPAPASVETLRRNIATIEEALG